MKYVKLFEQFTKEHLITEKTVDVNDKVKSNPGFAKKMLQYAAEEDADGKQMYQTNYTVQTNPPDWDGPLFTFNTMDAIQGAMGINTDDAPFDYGIAGWGKGFIEWFSDPYGDSHRVKVDWDNLLLADAIKLIAKLQKKAESEYKARREK